MPFFVAALVFVFFQQRPQQETKPIGLTKITSTRCGMESTKLKGKMQAYSRIRNKQRVMLINF